jgi:hypothetical protein
MTLYIVQESMKRQAVFNTNSDWTWMVTENEVLRVMPGSSEPRRGMYLLSFTL